MAEPTSLVIGDGSITSERAERGAAIERGLLIGGESVPAGSGGLADDVAPWDGQIYARGLPASRRTSRERSTLPRPRSQHGPSSGRTSAARFS